MHADAVPEQRSPGVRGRRIDRDDPDTLVVGAVRIRRSGNQARFPGARRSREADPAGLRRHVGCGSVKIALYVLWLAGFGLFVGLIGAEGFGEVAAAIA